MSKYGAIIAVVCALVVCLCPGVGAAGASPAVYLHLQRATFDPLRATPTIASSVWDGAESRLLIVQFDAAPNPNTLVSLEVAGLRPLLYVPDNAFLVRAGVAVGPTVTALPGVRWLGPLHAAYKLPAELEPMLGGAGVLDLWLLGTPDADADALARDLEALAGAIVGRGAGMQGPSLHLRMPAGALRAVLNRDDVLWVEPFAVPRLFNDRARAITGVTSAQQRDVGLTGAGQIIAITDTDLDIQADVEAGGNPDFAATRVVRGFSNYDLDPTDPNCQSTDWSDHNGHGTHVSGTALGSGARSPVGLSFAGVAPEAGLVVQSVSNGGSFLDCLVYEDGVSFLDLAYGAGARVQNASWGAQSDGDYTQTNSDIDAFLWEHKDHLFVTVSGNTGGDGNNDGVVDLDSITSPGSAKNVLTVGASENYRPPNGECSFSVPENSCWQNYWNFSEKLPFTDDYVSDDIVGMAAFSGRGPTDDGRIKPEIVAPGTNIVSTRSHQPGAAYLSTYGPDYAYSSGTSMAAPLVSGMGALVRQWLIEARHTVPSAALVKALLLNGAADTSPGQYEVGAQREIPAEWPNSVEGWGRAAITDTIDLGGDERVWLADSAPGLTVGAVVSYTLVVSDGQPLRVTLAWTDYPATPLLSKALVNDLDLEVQLPGGATVLGNANADRRRSPFCQDAGGADRCNNAESVHIAAPAAGTYIVRVRAFVVNPLGGPQPFALAARARQVRAAGAPAPPVLQPIDNHGAAALPLEWETVGGATYYKVSQGSSDDFANATTFTTGDTGLTRVAPVGTHFFRVQSCTPAGCGAPGNIRSATVTIAPLLLPVVRR